MRSHSSARSPSRATWLGGHRGCRGLFAGLLGGCIPLDRRSVPVENPVTRRLSAMSRGGRTAKRAGGPQCRERRFRQLGVYPVYSQVAGLHGNRSARVAPPLVSVVVPVRNGQRTIEACLTSILRCDFPEARREVVVVDNASTDRTANIVHRYPVKYVHEPTRGRSHARNRGIQASEGSIVAFTDADCVAAGSWLRELVKAFDEDAVSGVAGEILPDHPSTPSQVYMARRKPCWQRAALTSPWPYAVTANVAFRRDVFDRIGAFDPLLPTGEDQDISWRFLQAGLTLRYAPAAIVFHRHRSTAWEFFVQQLGWAHGSWRLRSRYGLPGGLRAQGGQRKGLVTLTTSCVRAGCSYLTRGGSRMDFYNAQFALIREVAWHVAGTYSPFLALRDALRPAPRVRLDVRRWRVRDVEPVGDPAARALGPATPGKS